MTQTGTQKQEEWLSGPPGYPTGTRIRKVLPEGRGTSGILILGDAPDEQDVLQGVPFSPLSNSGSVLANVFRKSGINREVVTLSIGFIRLPGRLVRSNTAKDSWMI